MTVPGLHVPYRALIVDDESLARQGLRAMLGAEREIDVVGEASTVAASAAAIRDLKPDIVFLDVQLPDADGFRLLSGLGAADAPTIVFVTAHANHALRAFDMSAADYLLKPFDPPRLARAVRRAVREVEARRREATGSPSIRRRAAPSYAGYPERVLVRERDVASFVSLSDVGWIEVYGNYVRLFVNGRPRLMRTTLNGISAQLDPALFLQISRSAIVNVQHVTRVRHRENGQADVYLTEGVVLQSSRRYRRAVRAAFR